MVSQPFAAFESQSPNPAVQATWQAPAAQLGAPLAELQTRPQTPQLSGSFTVETSHPVAYDRSQFAWVPSQLRIPQFVPRQVGVPF